MVVVALSSLSLEYFLVSFFCRDFSTPAPTMFAAIVSWCIVSPLPATEQTGQPLARWGYG